MKKILLVDVDSVIPNIPLMKLSNFYKGQGYRVDFLRLGLPYYPCRRREPKKIVTDGYERTFCSIVFEGTRKFVIGDHLEMGGTGIDLTTTLPEDVELTEPDYTLYPDNDMSYGFLTRGCSRKCSFCKVPQKEGGIRRVANVDNIVRHKKTAFLDNNILAYDDHGKILMELIAKNVKCCFTQGLDVRLVTVENSKLLSELNYLGNYTFAFDSWAYKDVVAKKLELLRWRKDWQFRFFVYVSPAMPISDTVRRIDFLKERNILPYIMRDLACWDDPKRDFYTDLAAWGNQPALLKKKSFGQFLEARYPGKIRINTSLDIWEDSKN